MFRGSACLLVVGRDVDGGFKVGVGIIYVSTPTSWLVTSTDVLINLSLAMWGSRLIIPRPSAFYVFFIFTYII